MQFTKILCVLFLLVFAFNLSAAEKETIAVIEFKNRSESALHFNGTDLAAWMSTDLKKYDRFEPVDRKAVQKIVKNAEWQDERLNEEAESQLREIPAKYGLYGSLMKWQSTVNTVTGGEITQRKTTKAASGVFVAFYFELVDLEKGKSIKSFQTEGDGLMAPGPGPMEGSASVDMANFDRLYEDASKMAIRRAVVILSELE